MGIRDLFRKQPPAGNPRASGSPSMPPTAASRPAAIPAGNLGVTKIEREHFLLHAPFQWIAVPGENPLEFEFRNQTLREQLIITILLARESLSTDRLQSLAEELAKKRLNAIAKISSGRAECSPLRLQRGPGQAEARSVGRDDSNKVRLAFAVRVAPTKVVTVALTRYFLEEVGTPFEAYAGSIFDFLQLKDSGGSAGA